MWAHYAANATGIVVEFDNLHQVFPGDNTGVLRQVRPVSYWKELPGMTFEPQSHENLFFSKYLDWSYEKEFRVVMPLSDCRTSDSAISSMYFYDIPKNCVKRIITGWCMTAINVEAVKQQVGDINPNVEVLHARFTRGIIEIEEC